MTEITFQGIAPIPTGTNVEMDVDDVKDPKEAYSIFDRVHGITYHFRPKPEKMKAETITSMKAYKADPGGRIKVTVNSVAVFQNSTVLTVFIGQP